MPHPGFYPLVWRLTAILDTFHPPSERNFLAVSRIPSGPPPLPDVFILQVLFSLLSLRSLGVSIFSRMPHFMTYDARLPDDSMALLSLMADKFACARPLRPDPNVSIPQQHSSSYSSWRSNESLSPVFPTQPRYRLLTNKEWARSALSR